MKRILMVAIAFGLCLTALSVPTLQSEAEASTPVITLYPDDRLGWEGAVGTYEEECFTDATLNPRVSVVSEYPGYIDTTKGVWWDRLVCPAYGKTTTTWHFSTPIIAFGGDWDPGIPGGPGANIALAINGGWVLIGEIPATYTGQFWGFVSSEPFHAVRLSPGSRCDIAWCETYELDNMVYAFQSPVKIIAPSEGDTFWIEAEPTPVMPTINCQAKIVGITPDPTPSTKFTWHYEIHYNPSEHSTYGPNRDISYEWPTSQSTGGNMLLNFRNVIRGGDLTIRVSATINGDTYSDTRTVRILARNPSVNAIKSQLGDNHTLWRIASRESNLTQFLPDPDGYPLWSRDRLGGVGIMQLTPPSSDDQIWDWTRNCDGGRAKLQQGMLIANRWHTTVKNSPDFQSLVSNYNQMRAQQGLPPLTISVPKLTAGDFNENVQQREKAAIRMYNGCAGNDPWLPSLRLHEYRIDLLGGILHVVNINERSRRGEAVWVRVPASERPPGIGDPNYVEHVLSEPLP